MNTHTDTGTHTAVVTKAHRGHMVRPHPPTPVAAVTIGLPGLDSKRKTHTHTNVY